MTDDDGADAGAGAGAGLTDRERAVLDFEARQFRTQGAKEAAIRERLGLVPTRYFQILNALLDSAAALAYAPVVVNRLRRRRETQREARG